MSNICYNFLEMFTNSFDFCVGLGTRGVRFEVPGAPFCHPGGVFWYPGTQVWSGGTPQDTLWSRSGQRDEKGGTKKQGGSWTLSWDPLWDHFDDFFVIWDTKVTVLVPG